MIKKFTKEEIKNTQCIKGGYLRDRTGKSARIKEKIVHNKK